MFTLPAADGVVAAGVPVSPADTAGDGTDSVGDGVGVGLGWAFEWLTFGRISQYPSATRTTTTRANTAFFWPGLRSTAGSLLVPPYRAEPERRSGRLVLAAAPVAALVRRRRRPVAGRARGRGRVRPGPPGRAGRPLPGAGRRPAAGRPGRP